MHQTNSGYPRVIIFHYLVMGLFLLTNYYRPSLCNRNSGSRKEVLLGGATLYLMRAWKILPVASVSFSNLEVRMRK
jgi:hypothetical protein